MASNFFKIIQYFDVQNIELMAKVKGKPKKGLYLTY